MSSVRSRLRKLLKFTVPPDSKSSYDLDCVRFYLTTSDKFRAQATNGKALIDIPVNGLVDEKVTKKEHLIAASRVKEALKNADLGSIGTVFKDEGVFFRQRTGDYFQCEQEGEKRWPDLENLKDQLDPDIKNYPRTYVMGEGFTDFLQALRSNDVPQALTLVFDSKSGECSISWLLSFSLGHKGFYSKIRFTKIARDKAKHTPSTGDLFAFAVDPLLLKRVWEAIKPPSYFKVPELQITPVTTTSSEKDGITIYEGALRITTSEYDDDIALVMPLGMIDTFADVDDAAKRVKEILNITKALTL